jgi:hypothetical protein
MFCRTKATSSSGVKREEYGYKTKQTANRSIDGVGCFHAGLRAYTYVECAILR